MDSVLQAVLAAMVSFFVITLIFACIFVICKGGKRRRQEGDSDSSHSHTRTRTTRTVPSSELSSIAIGHSASFDPTLCRIDMAELVLVTRNFAAELVIGDGSFGLVYKAKLPNGVTVAAKKLSADAFQGYREFRAEMETLGNIRHRNIVRILGYCATGSDRVLIYEFIEKGSLDQWLHDTSEEDADSSSSSLRVPLSWDTRVNIAKGVARGLCYMHSLEIPIIHRDIKASNVLLDSNFEAHIADFGLARRIEGSHSHVSTQVAGTMGYIAPEIIHGTTMATMKGDVYSFGVLMLEIATGCRPNLPYKDEDDGVEVRLVDWTRKMLSQNRHMEMFDVTISRDGLEGKETEILHYFRIAALCTSEIPKDRPEMREVVVLLDGIST